MSTDRRRLVAIVGATATGKSGAAIALAEAFNGEVVSTDAYQLYRGLDIGTAKVSTQDRDRVPHHLIDIADPNEPMTLALYLEAARAALDDVWGRNKLPVLAGGSGQYTWALLEGWQVPRVEPDPALRSELEALAASAGPEAIRQRLAQLDPEAALRDDMANTRRAIRAIEVVSATRRPLSACQTREPIDADVLVLGLQVEREALYERLDRRTDAMYEAGFVAEVESLRERGFGETNPLRSGVGYKELSAFLDGKTTLDEALTSHKSSNHRLVRRQHAWFRPSDDRIAWREANAAAVFPAVAQVEKWLGSLERKGPQDA